MKYRITFYNEGQNMPIPVLTKKEDYYIDLWRESVEWYELDEAYRILEQAGYEFIMIDEDGWHEFNYDGYLAVTLEPEDFRDEGI